MKRRGLPLLLASLVIAMLAIPGIALAGSDHETGNACPPPTPRSDSSPPPGCGTDNGTNGTNGGTNGTSTSGTSTNGTNGGTNGTGGNTTNACPPQSPSGSDHSPPPGCGQTDSGTSTSGTSTSGTSTSGTSTSGTSTSGTSTSGTSTSGTSTSGTSTSGTSTTGTSTTADPCTAAAGDPGITGNGTIAQQLYDGGLSALPIVQDPDADGPISSQIYAGGNGTQLEPLTDEIACLVNLPVLDL